MTSHASTVVTRDFVIALLVKCAGLHRVPGAPAQLRIGYAVGA
jgi:hypothetical protein